MKFHKGGRAASGMAAPLGVLNHVSFKTIVAVAFVAMPLAAAQAQWTSTPNFGDANQFGATWRDQNGNTITSSPRQPVRLDTAGRAAIA